jgi:hypothetical protein
MARAKRDAICINQRNEQLAERCRIYPAGWVLADSRFFLSGLKIFLESLASRTCRSSSWGKQWFPGLVDRHLGETTAFPDLSIVISGKPLLSRTCRSLSRGNQCFPGLADRHLRETSAFPDLSIVISGKPVVSRTCRSSNQIGDSEQFPQTHKSTAARRWP